MKNQGISLISLIITIIVVIILAAIAIFSGFGAVDSASLADFAQKYDNVQMAVLNTYGNVLAEEAIAGRSKNSEQIYAYIGGRDDFSGEAFNGEADKLLPIDAEAIGMDLPKVGNVEGTNNWKITKSGKVVFAPGFKYKNGNETKVYVTPEVASGDAAKAIQDATK